MGLFRGLLEGILLSGADVPIVNYNRERPLAELFTEIYRSCARRVGSCRPLGDWTARNVETAK
jgi:hypothetical protein